MIKPINEYLVLKDDETEQRIGKIILATPKDKSKSNIGIVVAISNFKDENIKINVGDKVIYRDYAVTEYMDKETKLYLVQLEDVLGIIE